MTTKLTPLALSHADVLREINRWRFDRAFDETVITAAQLAQRTGRIASNVRRDLPKLDKAGLIVLAKTDNPLRDIEVEDLTDDGRAALEAIGRAESDHADTAMAGPVAAAEIALDLIDEAEGFNPRTKFAEDEMAELAASIADKGVLQPILVRPHPKAPGRYLVTAGARRRRAAILAGLTAIPAMVRDHSEADAFEAATIENLQRSDMTPIEEARAFHQIITARQADDADLKLKDAKEELAPRLRKTVRFIELRLQLLELPPEKQADVEAGRMSVKEAIQWLRDRPVPLTPRAQLALAEFFDAASRRKLANNHYATVEIVGEVVRTEHEGHTSVVVKVADSALTELLKARIFNPPTRLFEQGVETGRCQLQVAYWGEQTTKDRLPDALNAKKRPALIEQLRAEVITDYAGGIPEGEYAIPFLNALGVNTPEVQALVNEARQRATTAAQEHEERRRVEAETRAEVERASKARLAKMADVENELRKAASVNAGALAGSIVSHAADVGLTLPLFMTDDGRVLDAEANEVFDREWNTGPAELAQRRLLVGAINAAAGLETPTEEPFQLDANAMDRSDFLSTIALRLTEGDNDITLEAAKAKAEAGLQTWLADEGAHYGETGWDWNEELASRIAGAIRDFGQIDDDDDQVDLEDAIDAADEDDDAELELTPALARLAGAEA